MKKNKEQTLKNEAMKGFMLIELLVVISVMAILVAVSISIFSAIQKNNRDQKRLRDLQTIKQALELYRGNNHAYPASLVELDSQYLTTPPLDPETGLSYQFQKSPSSCTTANKDCTGFVVCASKEGKREFNPPQECLDYDPDFGIGLASD